ncbi:ATP-binding protein [Paenibacillus sp. TAB 01]|uniref:sensor histidine kinase n=1 Tax=Paenibacillus sp. TAB 01 TaxID=3368988 RepID=UPI0037509EBF
MTATIKIKFFIGFFVIFAVSLLALNHVIVQIIESSHEKIMTRDLIDLKNNSSVYVKQTFMINHYSSDEIYFGQMAKDMVEELRRVSSSDVGAYSVDGKQLYSSNEAKFASAAADDLEHAKNGQTAYTIRYSERTAEVFYAYPVVIDGKKVGILRFVKDFSLLYEQSRRILDFIYYATLAVFAAAFVFSYLLSRHITIPVVRLTQATSEVTQGNLEIRVNLRRKDEIGKLAENFSRMLDKIKSQIQKIERDRDRLEELNRHRKQFYDRVTHELKTPLTAIMGYARMIRDNGQGDEVFFNKGMGHIIDESTRLQEMVIRLLELSEESGGGREDFEPVETGQMLQEVCDAMKFKAERYGKTIQCTSEAGLWVEGQAQRLRQLCINLLDNAVKYGDSRTAIIVEARAVPEGRVQWTLSNQADDLSPGEIERLFEPYSRVGRGMTGEPGSRGLGLSICQAIVDEHQGSIRISSTQRTFTVCIQLPLADKARDLL